MAARPIQIDYTANVDDAIAGNDKLGDSLEDVRKEVQRLAGDTVTQYYEMTEAQKKAFREQNSDQETFTRASNALTIKEIRAKEKALDDLKTSTKKTYRDVEDISEKTSRKVADDATEGFGKAEKASGGLAGSVGGELSQAFQDFDGTAQSAAGSAVSALTGISAVLPGIGGLIGAAAGTITAGFFNLWKKSADDSKAAVKDMYNDFIASGQAFYTQSQRQSAIQAFLGDDAQMAKAKDLAKLAGTDLPTAILALIEKGRERDAVEGQISDKMRDQKSIIESVEGSGKGGFGAYAKEAHDTLIQLQGQNQTLSDLSGTQDDVITKSNLYKKTVDQANDSWSSQGKLIDDSGKKIDAIPKDVTVKYKADTSDLEAAQKKYSKFGIDVFYTGARPGQRVP